MSLACLLGCTCDTSAHPNLTDAATKDASANVSDAEVRAPHQVTPCPTNATTPTWEDITPPGVVLPGIAAIHAILVDPSDYAKVYVGTGSQGFYKSTDCGATWSHIDTGAGGVDFDKGRQGSMVIDPVDPNILYADSRYGENGVFKTTDGGISWTQLFTDATSKLFVGYGMVEWVAIDPTDHLHLTVAPHFTCETGHSQNCMLETFDGGMTWSVLENTPESGELGGHIMLNKTTWLWAQPSGGVWRTSDKGMSWTHVQMGEAFPYLFKAPDGTMYMPGGSSGVLSSKDGITWTIINAGLSESIAATSQAIYTSGGLNANLYNSAAISTPSQWAVIDAPSMDGGTGGWMMAGDPDHDILYSANFSSGLWRLSGAH